MAPTKAPLGLALFLAFLPSYSFSDPFTYGVTGNAAVIGLQWSMGSVLPAESGLQVNGVVYRYTTQKNAADAMLVHVQNENAITGGYIFRETDNWTGLPSNTITKSVPVSNVPLQYWGIGSIEVEGQGSVTNASVFYTYRVDECFNPQSSPTCDGYISPLNYPDVSLDLYDTSAAIDIAMQDTDADIYDDDEERAESKEKDDPESNLEAGLAAAENALTLASDTSQEAMLQSLNARTNIAMYYNAAINGGVYKEDIRLVDSKIPDNKRGLRNGLAQQILHETMVDMQYTK